MSTLGVGCFKARLRRLEAKALLWNSRARWPRRSAGSFVERRRRAGDLLEVGDRGWQQAVVRSAALEAQGGSDDQL